MGNAIAIAKSGMLSNLERLGSYSQNVSNAGTYGYRRQIPTSFDFASRLLQTPSGRYGASGASANGTDSSVGAFQQTNRPLDIAIEGPGFFVVSTPEGVRYTRRGDLRLDTAGRLVAVTGDPVLGNGGEVRLRSDQVDIQANGDIRSEGEIVGRLDVVEFDDVSALRYEGAELYARSESAVAQYAAASRIRQGYVEASNVKPLQDMLGLMETSRNFGMIRSVLMAYDSMLDVSINSMGSL